MGENPELKTPRQFAIRDLLLCMTIVASAVSALTGNVLGLTISVACLFYWKFRRFGAKSLLSASYGALAGYCIAHAFFGGSYPFGPNPVTESVCIMIGAAGGLILLSPTGVGLPVPATLKKNFMSKFIHIRSSKFPILPGEREELVNDGMYGKALAQYLQLNLRERGYDAPFVCCEDWGWWVELKRAPFAFGVCVYWRPAEDGPFDFVVTDGATGSRKWSWRKLRFIDTAPWVEKLNSELIAVFRADEEVAIIGVSDDFPDLSDTSAASA